MWNLVILRKFDLVNRMITLSVITLSGLHCAKKQKNNQCKRTLTNHFEPINPKLYFQLKKLI